VNKLKHVRYYPCQLQHNLTSKFLTQNCNIVHFKIILSQAVTHRTRDCRVSSSMLTCCCPSSVHIIICINVSCHLCMLQCFFLFNKNSATCYCIGSRTKVLQPFDYYQLSNAAAAICCYLSNHSKIKTPR